ncbi:MAG: PAS domain S-box protein, partial [Gammaproteobacteria bacterium]
MTVSTLGENVGYAVRVEDPDINAGIAGAPLAISDGHTPTRAGDFGDWFSALHANAWLVANVAGIVITLFLVGESDRGFGFVWGLFMGANASLFNYLAARSRKPLANSFDRNTVFVVFAGLLGSGWAIGAWLVAAGGSALYLASAIATSYIVVLLGLSVFAHQGSAYFVLLGAYGGPLGCLLLERFGAITTWASATLCLVPVLLTARLQHHAIAALSNLLGTLLPAAPTTVPAEYDDFVDQARSNIGHLRHAAADLAHLQATFKALPDAVIRIDADGHIEDMNRTAEVLTGFTASEARGQALSTIACLASPGDSELAHHICREVLSSGVTARTDDRTTLRRRDGAIRAVDFAMSRLEGGHERSGAVLLLRHVTERHNLRKSARRANHDELTNLNNRSDFETR